jgi:hypothetical protein
MCSRSIEGGLTQQAGIMGAHAWYRVAIPGHLPAGGLIQGAMQTSSSGPLLGVGTIDNAIVESNGDSGRGIAHSDFGSASTVRNI